MGLGNGKIKAEFKAENSVNGTPDGLEGEKPERGRLIGRQLEYPGGEEAKNLDKDNSETWRGSSR